MIICWLHSHFNSSNSHLSSFTTICMCHKRRSCFNCQTNNSIFSSFIKFYSLWQRRWKLNLILIFHLKRIFSIRILNLIFYFKLRKGITCVIKSLNKFSLVIIRIKIPSSTKHNHLNFISLMSSLLKRIKSIIYLFYRIKLIKPSSHRPRFWFDITLWHFRIIWTKNTMTWTRIRLS